MERDPALLGHVDFVRSAQPFTASPTNADSTPVIATCFRRERVVTAAAPIRVWVDGESVSDASRAISAFDRGLTLGDGVFETMRVLNGVAPLASAHLSRLAHGAERLGLVVPPGLRAHITEAAGAAHRMQLLDAVLRLTLTRGDALPGMAGLSGGAARSIVTLTPRIAVREEVLERGLTLITSHWRWSARRPTAGIKSLDYTANVLALREAHSQGVDDALVLDTDDRIVGCTASNICWFSDATLFTPSPETGALAGTTIGLLRALAPSVGLTVQEAAAPSAALLHADAACACSSIRGVVPITQLDGVTIGGVGRSPRFRALHDAWRAEMARLASVDFVVD
jgi:branched-chain amino acid aminotransferase